MLKLTAALIALSLPAVGLTHDAAHQPSAQLPGAKNAKVTQVYQHAVPDMPGRSVKGLLVEYGPGGFSPSHTARQVGIDLCDGDRRVSTQPTQ